VLVAAALAVLAAVVLAVGLANRPGGSSAAGAALDPGFKRFAAPKLPTQRLAGAPVDVRSLRGKPAVINFWASWCEGCKAEAPQLRAASRAFAGKARFVGVAVSDENAKSLAFARKSGWRYPLLADHSSRTAFAYGVVGMPTTVFLDRSGQVVGKIVGIAKAGDVEAKLRALG
jgi:thiol-disulfide isomerase/thioredoxin